VALEELGVRADDGKAAENDSPSLAASCGVPTRRGLAVRRIDVRRDEGVAMAEFALILPVFLMIVVGLLAFGRVFFYWIQTNHLANETARWAVVDRNPYTGKTLQQAAVDSSTIEFQNGTKVCIDFPGKDEATAELGDPVRVRVEKPFTVLPMLNVGTVTIRGTSTMRIENFADGADDPQRYHTADNLPSQAACT
jgi:Flp pilus assembly protein TadG